MTAVATDPARGPAQPGPAQPGAAQPGAAQPGAAQPALPQPSPGLPPPLAAPLVAPGDEPATSSAWRRRLLGSALTSLALLILALLAQLLLLSGIQQSRTQQVLSKDFRYDLSQALGPTGGPIAPGKPVAVLEIPGLHHLRQVVVEGTASGELMKGPGHRRNTVLPGQAGVSVLLGRRVSYGGPFGEIDALHAGDPLSVVTGQGKVDYVVERVRRQDDPAPPPVAAGGGRLVLGTATPPLWPNQPLFVDAKQVSPIQPTPAGRVRVVPQAENLLGTDAAAALPLALWAQLLVVVVVAYTWARARWGRREAYLVGVPIVLAVLWNLNEQVVRLLPNVL